MPRKPDRRFSIADVMILVPAAAVAAALLRPYMSGFARVLGYLSGAMNDPWSLWRGYFWLRGPGSCVVVPWMAAMIVIRLRRPRPRRIRLASQPGFAACLAVMASLLPGLAWYASIRHRPGFRRPEGFEQTWAIITHWSDTAVVGSWIALALARRWRPEPTWIDRMGRVLGGYWMFLLFGGLALEWMDSLLKLLSRTGP